MTRVRRFASMLTLVAMILGAVGCASVDPELVRSKTQGKTLVVASVLGASLNLSWVGTTIFNNEFGPREVPDWQIDEVATTAAAQAVDRSKRVAAVTVVSGITQERNKPAVLPSGISADFLLLIRPGIGGDPVWNTNQSFNGLGIAQRTFMGFSTPSQAHSVVSVQLIDLRANQDVVASATDSAFWPIDFKLTSGGKASMSTTPAPVVADADLQRLREPILSRLRAQIDKLVDTLGLR